MEAYQSKQAMIQHSQKLLYQEYSAEKQEWALKIEREQKKCGKMQNAYDASQIQIEEFEVSFDSSYINLNFDSVYFQRCNATTRNNYGVYQRWRANLL